MKVVHWEEAERDATYQDSAEENEDGDEDGVIEDQTQVESKVDSGIDMDWMNTSMSVSTTSTDSRRSARAFPNCLMVLFKNWAVSWMLCPN